MSIAVSGDWSSFGVLSHCLFDEAASELSQLGEFDSSFILTLTDSFGQVRMPRCRQFLLLAGLHPAIDFAVHFPFAAWSKVTLERGGLVWGKHLRFNDYYESFKLKLCLDFSNPCPLAYYWMFLNT